MVFNVLQDNSLCANGGKRQYAKEQVEYLGHLISAEGVGADREKLQAMIEYPAPANLGELCGFLGLTRY